MHCTAVHFLIIDILFWYIGSSIFLLKTFFLNMFLLKNLQYNTNTYYSVIDNKYSTHTITKKFKIRKPKLYIKLILVQIMTRKQEFGRKFKLAER